MALNEWQFTRFILLVSFYLSRKHQKTSGFLFRGGMERDQRIENVNMLCKMHSKKNVTMGSQVFYEIIAESIKLENTRTFRR